MISNPTTVNVTGQPPLGGNVILQQSGSVSLAQSGNTITISGTGGAGGNPVFSSVAVTLGPARSGTFDITGLSGLTVDNPVFVMLGDDAISSRGNARDEFEMDAIVATGHVVDSATVRVYWFCHNTVIGDFIFRYFVGG